MWGDTKNLHIILGISFALRLLFALRFSYLHPDEHLQGPQEIMHGSCGWASQTPWEFTNENPLRSFVPLWLIYGIPAGVFSHDTDPKYVMYTLRAVFAILTWVLEDMAVDRLASTRNDKIRCLFFVSTSYVTLTWQVHTLSNSFETVLVLWYLVILFEAENRSKLAFQSTFDRHYDSALLGLIVVIGIFNRPTFIAFLILPGLSLLKFWYRFPSCLITFTLSVALFSTACVFVDTFLYGKQNGWVITPLNFVKYNIASDNLSEHGLHSRFTHVLVNLPQLLGPGLLLLRPDPHSLAIQTTVGALAILSVFPHQEARFLLPLVPMLCAQMDLEQFTSSKVKGVLLTAWLGFNLTLGVIMGMFHQAGVIPGQAQIKDFERPAIVFWWKTYTPPLWVTGLSANEIQYAALSTLRQSQSEIEQLLNSATYNDDKNMLTEIDLQGADITVLEKMLASIPIERHPVYIAAPLAKYKSLVNGLDNNYTLYPVWKTLFHFGPDLLDFNDLSTLNLGLGIWQIKNLV